MKKWIAAAVAVLMCAAGTVVSADSFSANGQAAAVFDFEDNAFFTVPMQKGETIYLALDTSYRSEEAEQLLEQTGKEADAFYCFDTNGESFARSGLLFLQAQPEQTVYERTEDGLYEEIQSEYRQGYTIGKDGEKIGGFVIKTKQPGDYLIAD